MSFKNRFNIEYNMAAVVSHTIQALLATKPASVTWIGFGCVAQMLAISSYNTPPVHSAPQPLSNLSP